MVRCEGRKIQDKVRGCRRADVPNWEIRDLEDSNIVYTD